jgi:1-acyl-sn-glycerol-3-phosphate acyltransferase
VRRRNTDRQLVNKWISRWARAVLRSFRISLEAHGPCADERRVYPGCGPDGVGRIFIMNHRSAVDIPVILSAVEAHVISRHDLARWPLIGSGARRIGTLFVDRTSKRSGATVLRQVALTLEAGEGVAMFPEGTAFPGDSVREFRPGAFNAARRAGAQIVPLGVAYSSDAAYFSEESFTEHVRRIASLPSLCVALEMGEPLTTAGHSAVELTEQARDSVQQLVERARARLQAANTTRPRAE